MRISIRIGRNTRTMGPAGWLVFGLFVAPFALLGLCFAVLRRN